MFIDISFPEPEFDYPKASWIKLEDSSFNILPKLKNKFDLIFIDGDHGTKSVICDINNSLKIINKNGIILIHDTNYGPTKSAVKTILGTKVKYWTHRPDKFHGIGTYKNS